MPFVREPLQAGQLPSLQKLYLHVCDGVQEEVSVLGYQNLRRLVVRGELMQPVLYEPKCQLGTHLHAFVLNYPRGDFEPGAALQRTLHATTELGIGSEGCLLTDWDSHHSACQHCLDVETLTLEWPLCRQQA